MVVRTIPAVGRAPNGIEVAGGRAWIADEGSLQIFRINPADGAALSSFRAPDGFPADMAFDGTNLWNTDPSSDRIYRLDPASGTVLGSFPSPGPGPNGLAWDGAYLWSADWVNQTIYKVDPSTGSVVSSFPSPATGLPYGLAWARGFLYHADAGHGVIFKIDPASGRVLDRFTTPSFAPEGLSFDGVHFWYVDLITQLAYVVDLGNIPPCSPDNRPPVFLGNRGQCGRTYDTFVGTSFSLTVTASDPDFLDAVTLTASGPAGSSFTDGVGNPVSGTFDWTPAASDTGSHAVRYTASDGCDSVACHITIRVLNNRNPDCSAASASEPVLWPPDHTFHTLSILGVTDPEGDPVTITVTGVTQDEPVNAHGDGNSCPDARVEGGPIAVRAERAGTASAPGNGRVYVIRFTASDGHGGTCAGAVSVCVPHDQGANSTCTNDGQRYASLGSCTVNRALTIESVPKFDLNISSAGSSGASIEFQLAVASEVHLTVFDVAGRQLATLERAPLAAGTYSRTWNMTRVSNGLFYVRLRAGDVTITKPLLKVR